MDRTGGNRHWYEVVFVAGLAMSGLGLALDATSVLMVGLAVAAATRAGAALARPARGAPRNQAGARASVARAIGLSWILPGLGQLYARDWRDGALTTSLTVVIDITSKTVDAPQEALIPAAILVWTAGQVGLRRYLGIGWFPIVPRFTDLFDRR